jgi:hypothetical protein
MKKQKQKLQSLGKASLFIIPNKQAALAIFAFLLRVYLSSLMTFS